MCVYIYIVYLLGALGFQRVTGSPDPTPPFGSAAPPQTDQASSRLKSYPRPPRIRVSAWQRLRAGGSSARRLPSAWQPCRNLLPLLVPSASARSRVPRGAMGLRRLQRLRDSGTNARGRADPTRADHDDDGRHASVRVWRDPARTGRGSGRCAAGRFWRGQKGSVAGGRRVRS
jgi:hypothetical protein